MIRIPTKAILASGAALIALGAAPAAAQGTEPQPANSAGQQTEGTTSQDTTAQPATQSGIQDIVVTAERRSTSVQRTPLNISVVGGDTLQKQGITSSRELLDSISGLKMTVANPNNYIGLYGTGSAGGSQYGDAVMSFNYGGVPLARQIAASSAFFDLERVEVLKGPQGTLYGRNATVGAINVVIARPRPTFSGSASVTYGSYDTLLTTGHINAPLGEHVAARVAFQTSKHDGYFSNGYDDADNYGVRGSVMFDPTPDLNILMWADVYRNRSRGPFTTFRYYTSATQEWLDPNDPWFGLGQPGTCSNQLLCPTFAATSIGGVNAIANPTGFTSTGPTGFGTVPLVGGDGFVNNDQNIVATEANWRTGIGTLTALGAWVKTKIDYLTYSNGLKFANRSDVDQYSAELRLASDSSSRLRYVLGGFYFFESQNAFQSNLQSNGYALLVTPNLDATSAAAFGDLTFSVTDFFRLSGGLRYTYDKKTQDGFTTAAGLSVTDVATVRTAGGTCTTGGTPANPTPFVYQGATYYFPSNFCVVPNGGVYKDNNLTWKVGAEFDVGPDSMLFGSVRTGYRAGGFTNGTDNNYRPEKLTSFEIGSRNRFFDRQLQLNLTGFYWKYQDQQISQLQLYFLNGIAIGQTSFPSNFDGNLYGVELDAQAQPTPNDRLSLNVLWTKGKYDQTPPVATLTTTTLVPQFNLPRNNLPEWVVNAGYNHTFAMANGATVVPAARMHYESDAVLRIIDPALLTPGDRRKSYAKFDLDITYNAPGDRFSVQAFVKNVANKAVVGVGSSGQVSLPTFFRPSSSPASVRSATLDPPRTYGVRLSTRF